jgi:hypothetical protein
MVRTNIETTPPMLKSLSDNHKDMPKDVVESSMGVHNIIIANL